MTRAMWLHIPEFSNNALVSVTRFTDDSRWRHGGKCPIPAMSTADNGTLSDAVVNSGGAYR